MTTPLAGTSGVLTINGTNIVWAGEWEHTIENNTETIGPHIGDAVEYEVATSQKYSFKISGTVPSGGDAGQNALMAAAAARSTAPLVLEQTLGKSIAYSAATFTKLTVKAAAAGTQTFEIEGGNGAGTAVLSQDT